MPPSQSYQLNRATSMEAVSVTLTFFAPDNNPLSVFKTINTEDANNYELLTVTQTGDVTLSWPNAPLLLPFSLGMIMNRVPSYNSKLTDRLELTWLTNTSVRDRSDILR